jgi:UDPglucose--hexose-1-phosphate uridylyltransferase
MPELRTDWLSGRSVIVAENRALRPNEFALELQHGEPASAGAVGGAPQFDCPFCAGNESRTPAAVYQSMDANGQWRVRVVPNKFPALTNEPTHLDTTAAVGAHEVIIESARHVDRMSALSVTELRDVLHAYSQRLVHWQADERFDYGLVFKNQGPQAGATLAHVHSQLIAVPHVPSVVMREFKRAAAWFEDRAYCAYCGLVQSERTHGNRIVLDSGEYVAFCPFASLQPLEVWLLPTAHDSRFERPGQADEFDALAKVLHVLLGRLEAIVPGASYNMLLRTGPWHTEQENWFHWRIELLPRITPLAGLELAAGIHINPLPPEQAARRLRDA